MNEQKISHDDPKLTAYALGELTGEERAAVESVLKNDPAAQAAVAEIRALATQLEGALAAEALEEPVDEVQPQSVRASSARVEDPYRKKVIRFPYVWVGTLAAACFAVVVALRDNRPVQGLQHTTGEEKLAGSSASPLPGTEVARTQTDKAAPAAEVAAGGRAVPSVLLVKDADEFAAIPAPETPVVKTEADSVEVAATSGGIAPPAFVAATEPIKTTITYEDVTPSIKAVAAAEVTASAGQAKTIDPVVLAEKSTALPAVAPVEGETLVLSEEVVHLGAFVVDASRERSSYAASATMAGTGNRQVLHKNTAAAGSSYGFFYDRTDLVGSSPAPRMSFRAKSTAEPMRNRFNTESYSFIAENDFFRVRTTPLSTFSIDVDTASYANVRRFLDHGQRPPRDAVRVEEMVNYFDYRYAPPAKEVKEPFAASMEIATAPWNPAHRLVRIGLKGREISTENRPAANLVFLLDVSGSMSDENKLPLVKESLRLLVDKLRADDRVAIVTYAGNSGLALASTQVSEKKEILEALDELLPGGSTNGAMGIQLAYDIAKANFIENGANRVILCTDGDFNVGVTNDGDLTRLIEEKAKSGVFLTVLGFGMGNLKDSTLERLADRGNGNYGYIDSTAEAQKLLVEQAGGTLVTIAKDVKLQVEFNPAVAQAYRLIGYENRVLNKEDFNNDKVDAGEIGAGHTVTALYEIVPVGAPAPESTAGDVDVLKYQKTDAVVVDNSDRDDPELRARKAEKAASKEELLTLKIRFKEPTVDVSRKIEIPVIDTGAAFEAASKDFKFAAAVASLGMILRESENAGRSDYDRVISWAEAGKGDDTDGRRGEFIELVKKARALSAE